MQMHRQFVMLSYSLQCVRNNKDINKSHHLVAFLF
ncbi:hypothetical protein NTHI1209_00741 [Haemophilus influenzae]|uniref:Uncharacterized protein n=1 Tax=Haemophilus influenzae TaxID=727 RepID=A0A158SW94_HAEIF|nr:hypothetical protein NTHI1209_00741 [Haemophilus influenzae]